jgi:ABC-2 type transport system permease protein
MVLACPRFVPTCHSAILSPDATGDSVRTMTAPNAMPLFNVLGFVTFFSMEFRRYLKAWQHAIVAPVITTLLFFAIFDLTLGAARADVAGVPFLTFVAPGLISMTVMLTAFEMCAWSTIDARIRGTMDALVAAPLRTIEFVAAPVLACAAAGLMNGLIVSVAMQPFVPIAPEAPLAALGFAAGGAIILAAAGMAAGIYAEKFDHVASILSFVVTPAIFLSGVFFPVAAYGGVFADIAHASPFFWVVDGLRQGLLGVGDMRPGLSAALLGTAVVVAVAALWSMVARGYKLKQ